LTPAEVEELVRVFADARAEYLSRLDPSAAQTATESPPSELIKIIDRWLDATRHNPPPSAGNQVLVTSRPAPLENLFANFGPRNDGTPSTSLSAASPSASTQDWPPSHLAPADAEFLNYHRIRELLAGVSWGSQAPMPNDIGEKSDPLALRLWLGWLGAAHTPPNSPFALYLAPVAFENNKERKEWYDTSGGQSKMFGHMEGFLGYAAERFSSGKKMVLGLVTHIFPKLLEAKAIVSSGGRSNLDNFNNHPKLRRFGVAVLLRLVVRNGVQGLQVTFFSPWDKHDWIKESWRPQKWGPSELEAETDGHGASLGEGMWCHRSRRVYGRFDQGAEGPAPGLGGDGCWLAAQRGHQDGEDGSGCRGRP
jgi:hypothetical protein